jgi:hypothetical protein
MAGVLSNAAMGFMSSGAGYTIATAVRLDGVADYFSLTLTTDATTSGSVWVKKHENSTVNPIFDGKIYFNSSDQLVAFGLTSTAVYRDPTSTYHIFWNSSGIWVNGEAVTGSGTYSQTATTNPRLGYDGTNYAAITVSNFAFYNGASVTLTGSTGAGADCAPERPSLTSIYSYLDFADTADLGNDVSGNNNDWTLNSLSSADAVSNTPTNNFWTWNALDKTATTLSNGNLTAQPSSADNLVRGTIGVSAGKWFVSFHIDATSACNIGLSNAALLASSGLGYTTDSWSWRCNVGLHYNNVLALSATATVGDDIDFAVDLDIGAVWVRKNGTWLNSATTGEVEAGDTTHAIWTNLTGTLFPAFGSGNTSAIVTANAGATALPYAAPTGFEALCTANLPTPATAASVTPKTGSFTGNATAGNLFVWLGYTPDTAGSSTINGNAITWGTHALPCAGGFNVITSSTSYNAAGANTYSIAVEHPFGGGTTIPAKAR